MEIPTKIKLLYPDKPNWRIYNSFPAELNLQFSNEH